MKVRHLLLFLSIAGAHAEAAFPDDCYKIANGDKDVVATDSAQSKTPSKKYDGFKESYRAGLTEVEDLLALAQQLRSRTIDPHSTHIPELVPQITEHLQYAETGITRQNSSDESTRLGILKNFTAEAIQKISSNQVTYRWWVFFNFRLSILLTPKNKRTSERGGGPNNFAQIVLEKNSWRTEKAFERLVEQSWGGLRDLTNIGKACDEFPSRILMPTIAGDLGIIALNRSFLTGVYPIGLTSDVVWADGREMYPDHFFGHDLVHLDNERFSINRWEAPESRVKGFQTQFQTEMENLPQREREMLEFVWFIASHELTFLADDATYRDGSRLTDNLFGTRLQKLVESTMDKTWYGNLVPDWVDITSETSVKDFLIESGKTFNKLAARINPKLGSP